MPRQNIVFAMSAGGFLFPGRLPPFLTVLSIIGVAPHTASAFASALAKCGIFVYNIPCCIMFSRMHGLKGRIPGGQGTPSGPHKNKKGGGKHELR